MSHFVCILRLGRDSPGRGERRVPLLWEAGNGAADRSGCELYSLSKTRSSRLSAHLGLGHLESNASCFYCLVRASGVLPAAYSREHYPRSYVRHRLGNSFLLGPRCPEEAFSWPGAESWILGYRRFEMRECAGCTFADLLTLP